MSYSTCLHLREYSPDAGIFFDHLNIHIMLQFIGNITDLVKCIWSNRPIHRIDLYPFYLNLLKMSSRIWHKCGWFQSAEYKHVQADGAVESASTCHQYLIFILIGIIWFNDSLNYLSHFRNWRTNGGIFNMIVQITSFVSTATRGSEIVISPNASLYL